MADATVIREFLVKLGWRIDQGSRRDFDDVLTTTTLRLAKLAASVEAAAMAVVAGVAKMASSMEQLYFVSQRTGATVQGLQAAGYAFTQMGLSAAQFRGTIEGVAAALRSTPGLAGMLQGLGVNTNQPTEQVLQQFVHRTSNMPFYLQQRYASMLGIDPNALLVLRRGIDQFTQDYSRMAQRIGVESKQAAEAGHAFMVQFRSMGTVFDLLAIKVEQSLGRKLGDNIARFLEFLLDYADRINQAIATIVRVLLDLSETVVRLVVRSGQLINDVITWFTSLSDRTKTVIEALGALAVAWRAFNIVFAMTPIGMIVTAIAALIGGILLLYDDYKTFVQYGRQYSLLPWDEIITDVKLVIKWFEDLGNAVLPSRIGVWSTFKQGVGEVVDALKQLWHVLAGSGDETEGPKFKFQGLADFLRDTFVSTIKFVAGVISDILGVALHNIADIIKVIADLLRGDWSAAWRDATDAVMTAVNFLVNKFNELRSWIPNIWSKVFGSGSTQTPSQEDVAAGVFAPQVYGNAPTPAEWAERSNYMMNRFVRELGLSPAQAAGMTSRIAYESGFNPEAVNKTSGAYGLAQWLSADRRAGLFAYLKAHPEKSHMEAETDYIIHELKNKERATLLRLRETTGKTPEEVATSAGLASYGYERSEPGTDVGGARYSQRFLHEYKSLPPGAGAGASSAPGPTMHQMTTITVHGASDATVTAREIEAAQQRVNADAIRQLQGAHR